MNSGTNVGAIIFGVIFGVFFIGIFTFNLLMFFSPKLRGKFMGRQMKATKYMLDSSKETLSDIATTGVKIKKGVLDKNEEDLKNIAQKSADIEKGAIKTKARAVREGLLKDDGTVFCKHCGKEISADSKFCKYCGKEQ